MKGGIMQRKHTHIGAYSIITKENRIILIKKARGGYTGKLDLPGGGIEHLEKPTETLKRELMEEVGINITDYQLIDVLANNIIWNVKDDFYEDLHHLGIIYLVNTNDTTIKEEPDGIDSNGAAWYDINKLDLDNLTPFAKYAVNYLKK